MCRNIYKTQETQISQFLYKKIQIQPNLLDLKKKQKFKHLKQMWDPKIKSPSNKKIGNFKKRAFLFTKTLIKNLATCKKRKLPSRNLYKATILKKKNFKRWNKKK